MLSLINLAVRQPGGSSTVIVHRGVNSYMAFYGRDWVWRSGTQDQNKQMFGMICSRRAFVTQ